MERKLASARPTLITSLHRLIRECMDRGLLLRSLKTALVVGTILALINHGQQMLSGQFSAAWMLPTLLTYLVPFSVATYGQIQGKRNRRANATHTQSQVQSLASMQTLTGASHNTFSTPPPAWDTSRQAEAWVFQKKNTAYRPEVMPRLTLPFTPVGANDEPQQQGYISYKEAATKASTVDAFYRKM